MLKIFTLKYEERTESFNDGVMSNFLADKEILRWESHFFERKNEYSFGSAMNCSIFPINSYACRAGKGTTGLSDRRRYLAVRIAII